MEKWMNTCWRALATTLLLAALGAGPALAEGTPAGDTGGGWEKVDANAMMMRPGESFQANHLVAAAYGFIWLMVAIFVFLTWRKNQATNQEIDALRRQIDARRGKP